MSAIIGYYPQASQNVAIGASSTQSAATATGTWQVRLICDVDCYIAIGTSPTATSSSTWLPALSPEYFAVHNGDKVAVIQKVTTGTLNMSEMGR